jgi:hypothetical protein
VLADRLRRCWRWAGTPVETDCRVRHATGEYRCACAPSVPAEARRTSCSGRRRYHRPQADRHSARPDDPLCDIGPRLNIPRAPDDAAGVWPALGDYDQKQIAAMSAAR